MESGCAGCYIYCKTYKLNDNFGICTTYLGTTLILLLDGLRPPSGRLEGDRERERFFGGGIGLSILSLGSLLMSLNPFLSLSLNLSPFLEVNGLDPITKIQLTYCIKDQKKNHFT